MKEIDLIQAVATWINLSYTAAQWWLTITTALIVATYFAARHIPPWFFALIILLYFLTAVSVVSEFAQYSDLSRDYGTRLTDLRAAGHVSHAEIDPYPDFGHINTLISYVVFIVGSLSAAIFSFIHWRTVRKA